MQISNLPAGQAASGVSSFPGGFAAAAAALGEPGAALDRQLAAYRALAAEYRAAGSEGRAALAPALNESPFARRAQATLNAFTRAAWAGPDASPPDPEARMLRAFDGLSPDDQKIVAALQSDGAAEDYRARLAADLQTAEAAASLRRPDSVTLSAQAQAHLAGGPPPEAVAGAPAPARPDMAGALAAYAKASGA